jgi:hypothetical protein
MRLLAGVAILISGMAVAQTADPALMAEIHRIRAIDNHSHPPKLVAAGEKDDEFDALPCDPLEPTEPNTMTRPENPMYAQAWKALWGQSQVKDVLAAKERIRREQGDRYSAWVLDRIGIDTEFANRIALGRGLTAPQFRWVPFDDALLFPLDNSELAKQTPDRKFFFSREGRLLERYRNEAGLTSLPPTLSEYVAKVVRPSLERQKQQGAVAIKFEAAYLRALDFAPAPEAEAAEIYATYLGKVPPGAQYTVLQNFLFQTIATEAARLGLPVQLHTGAGCGGYFNLKGSDPLLLEPVLNDAQLRKTTFVLLHGGAVAFTESISYLMMKPNVYADLSQQTWMLSPHKLSLVLRDWLEWYPEKVLFGTDLYPGSGAYDWEEIGWQTAETARRALGLALTAMMQDGEITRARAVEIGRMVLRENALKLYRLDAAPAR